MDQEDYLTRLLPHRLNALAIAALMLEFVVKWEEPKPMEILVNGTAQFEGTTAMFSNPIVEVGVLHARTLLEFIGLKVWSRELVQMNPSRRDKDDAGIEMIVGPNGSLRMVTPEEVGAAHPCDPESAREALVQVVLAAHKGLAHASKTYFSDPLAPEQMGFALQLTQKLVERHVYVPLGRDRPPVPIEAWARRNA